MRHIIEENVRIVGRHIIYVPPEPERQAPALAYTIGNSLVGYPELLVLGNFTVELMASLLHGCSIYMLAQKEPLAASLDMGPGYPIRTRWVSEDGRTRLCAEVPRFLGHGEFQMQQLLLCDPQGCYPGDEAISPDYDVPLV